ncbi:MAG: hypothetical protein ACJAZH_000880 [Roseivirga sp.]|jgi:hypothetical protein
MLNYKGLDGKGLAFKNNYCDWLKEIYTTLFSTRFSFSANLLMLKGGGALS